jgi:hypothetical protein
MTQQDALNSYRGMLTTIGKIGAQALFPNDFEVYFTAFELVDTANQTVDYFAFPLNPNSITETHPQLTNIKKTAGGITTLSTPTFVPKDIVLNGNFGRKFKVLLGQEQGLAAFSGLLSSGPGGILSDKTDYSKSIKTGFGCMKVLERIITRAQSLDARNDSYSLYFYNLSLGNSYLVKPISLTFSQNSENNMIWQYALTLKALAPLDQIKIKTSSTESPVDALGTKAIQRTASTIANRLSQFVL